MTSDPGTLPRRHMSTSHVEVPWCDACELGSSEDQCPGCGQPYTAIRVVPR